MSDILSMSFQCGPNTLQTLLGAQSTEDLFYTHPRLIQSTRYNVSSYVWNRTQGAQLLNSGRNTITHASSVRICHWRNPTPMKMTWPTQSMSGFEVSTRDLYLLWVYAQLWKNSCSLVKLSLGELKRRGTKTPASFLRFYVSDLRSSLI